MSVWERLFRDVKQWKATGIPPWETPEYKERESSEFEADGPHFHCEQCLEITPTYLAYKDEDYRMLCYACFDEYISEGEEWQ